MIVPGRFPPWPSSNRGTALALEMVGTALAIYYMMSLGRHKERHNPPETQ